MAIKGVRRLATGSAPGPKSTTKPAKRTYAKAVGGGARPLKRGTKR